MSGGGRRYCWDAVGVGGGVATAAVGEVACGVMIGATFGHGGVFGGVVFYVGDCFAG